MEPIVLINKFRSNFDLHMQELLSGSTVALFLKIIAAGIAFFFSVVLARLLGVETSGVFFLAYTIVLVIASIGRVGMENALVKFIAANVVLKQPEKVIGVYWRAINYSFIVSSILSVLLYFSAQWICSELFNKPEMSYILTIMATTIVPLSLLTLHASALQGLKKIAASITVLSIGAPVLTCLISIIFVPYYGVDAVAWGYLLATSLTLFLGRWFWKKAIAPFECHTEKFERNELLATSMPLFGVVVLNLVIIWSPMLLLGVWESNENIGVYSAASRTAMLTSFILVAVNSIATPKFSALYQQGDMAGLNSLARQSSILMTILALPVLMLLIIFPEWVLSIFGEQFEHGSTVLVILSIGQFINVITGSVGYLLMMTGNEKLMRNNLIFSAILGGGLNLWLIPVYGMLGAAIATAIVLSTQNVIATIIVWKKLKILIVPRLWNWTNV